MKSDGNKSSPFVINGGEGTLSDPALIELLQAVLDRGKPFRFLAPGFSMSPFIRNGDIITISKLPGDSPGFGKAVAFIHPKTRKPIVHRIVGKNGAFCLIKGDNTPEADGLVPKANILGYVSKVERNGKQITFGLGPERFLIAHLSREGLLIPLMFMIVKIGRPIFRRFST